MPTVFLVCLAALLAAGRAPAQTVFVYSLDGLGHQFFTQHPSALPTLHRLAARGAQAAGIQPAFPSTTANSHAALWTGAYGDVSHITANSQPVLPRAAHTFLERNNGYRADQLAAEPIWITAARQGVSSVVYQAPQVFPFLPTNTHSAALTINGYQSRQLAGHLILRRKDLVFDTPTTFHFAHGSLNLSGSLTPRGLRIGGIDVPYAPAESGLAGHRALARRFSKGMFLTQPFPAVIYFRLFTYSADDLLLYVSPIQELAMSRGDANELLHGAGGFIGNTEQGPALSHAESLEVMELLVRQNYRHTQWLVRRHHPRLFIGYLPAVDELLHRYLGQYLRHDPDTQRRVAWGLAIVDRWCQEVVKLARAQDHLVVTSDHGMAPTYRAVNVNEILRRAGLSDRAVHIYNSVLLNDRSWKNGTVDDRAALRDQVQAALAAVRDDGAPVFTGFFTPEEHGKQFGLAGPAASDLYFDLALGYSVRDVAGEIFPPLATPGGNHGFRPDRDDMLALLLAAGPRLKKGERWLRRKSIDVAPLIADLLSIAPPRDARGASPRKP